MEQGRLFLAIVLSFLVFIAWEFLFVDKHPVPPLPSEKPVESAEKPLLPEEQSAAAETVAAEIVERLATPGDFFGSLTVRTPLYSAVISEKGAGITGFTLHQYRESLGKNSPDKELLSGSNSFGTGLLSFSDSSVATMFNAVFTTEVSEKTIQIGDTPATISFYWQSPKGMLVEKRFTFLPDSYEIRMDIVLTNTAAQPFAENLIVSLFSDGPENKRRFSFEGPFAYVDNHLEEVDLKDLGEKDAFSGAVQWAGITSQYFMSAVIPETAAGSSVRMSYDEEKNLIQTAYVYPEKTLAPGAAEQYSHSLYIGPRKISELKAVGSNLDKAINFGFFDIIAKPCLWLMNAIHDHMISNYGVAIILLTILFKIIFWPLGTKSYKSMAEMKRLQPLMMEIRQKYKDDKKKMNEEIMGLYRTYKVNPMSGCLPMVVQIPVFFAFYRMLYGSIELRHAPFFGWINDLSAPDRLFSFDFTIPLMVPPYGIPVLTIIMGATMFLQQKLSPPPGDPSQAKFMMMMPLIFTFIFINFPAGLVLYWLVNNVLSISQQYYITQKTL